MTNKTLHNFILAGLTGFILACLLIVGASEHHYNRKAMVTDVSNYTVTCEDVSGNVWVFEADDLSRNDFIELQMDDNGTTEDITDDVITGYKK